MNIVMLQSDKTFRNIRGFTLIELIILVIVISIISSIVFLSDTDTNTVSLRSTAEQIAGEIRYVQNLGFTKGARYRINFSSNCQGSGLSCYWLSNVSNSVQIDNPRTNTSTVQLPSGILLSTTTPTLIFNGKGIPYTTDTGSALTSDANITLTSSDGKSQQVIVSPETGKVVVQ